MYQPTVKPSSKLPVVAVDVEGDGRSLSRFPSLINQREGSSVIIPISSSITRSSGSSNDSSPLSSESERGGTKGVLTHKKYMNNTNLHSWCQASMRAKLGSAPTY